MVQITVDFSEEEDRKIGIIKGQYRLPSKESAVRKIVQLHKIELKNQ